MPGRTRGTERLVTSLISKPMRREEFRTRGKRRFGIIRHVDSMAISRQNGDMPAFLFWPTDPQFLHPGVESGAFEAQSLGVAAVIRLQAVIPCQE